MFRPSGNLAWALACTKPRQWHFFGSINSESRSLETAKALCKMKLMANNHVLRIKWPDSPYSVLGEDLTLKNIETFRKTCGEPVLLERDLLATVPDFIDDPKKANSKSVILDITSMPKRFFFLYLKKLIHDPEVEDLIITYCAGEYDNESLSSNHEDWDVLPTFRGGDRTNEESARSRLVVNVGFMPGGLQEHLRTDDTEQDLFLILPVPAKVSSTRRVWKSAMEIQHDWRGDRSAVHIRRIAPEDVSGAFDLIRGIANSVPISLAPFGPKPISTAMCIYSALNTSPVYYAQPKWYNPSYTRGADLDHLGEPRISAHWIKHNGQSLYQL